jgi:opacity protein-like surface antigen
LRHAPRAIVAPFVFSTIELEAPLFRLREKMTGVSLLLSVISLAWSPAARGEWVVTGYGGASLAGSMGGKFSDVTMPYYGQQLAMDQFPSTKNPVTGDTLTQNFKTTDLKLTSSPMFGGKATYFLDDPSWTWLGFEVEAFTTKPNISNTKQQTVDTTQDITFSPSTQTITDACLQGVPSLCPQVAVNKGTLTITETSLRVTTLAANLIARYPGTVLQPYVGAGVGAFYFRGSGQFEGHQFSPGFNGLAGLRILLTEQWALMVEGKYNLSNVSILDPVYGLDGTYSIFHVVVGGSYRF